MRLRISLQRLSSLKFEIQVFRIAAGSGSVSYAQQAGKPRVGETVSAKLHGCFVPQAGRTV